MKKKHFLLILAVILIILVFTGCGDKKAQKSETTTETTTEITTVVTTEETTEPETEEATTKAPETTKKQEYKPAENTKKPTDAPANNSSVGGGLFTWDDGPGDPDAYVQDPDTDGQYWVDKEAEELGENLDWTLA